MANSSKKIQELILKEIQEVKSEIKEVRQTDIPNMKVEVAVIKSESKQSAKIISAAIGLITMVLSVAMAWFKGL